MIFAVLGAAASLIGAWHYIAFQERAAPARLPRINRRVMVGFGLVISLLGVAMALTIALGG